MLGVYEVPVAVSLMTTLAPPVLAVGSVGRSAALVATMIRYEVAPLTADQLNAGVVDCPVAPFDGALSVGAGNVVCVPHKYSLVAAVYGSAPLPCQP